MPTYSYKCNDCGNKFEIAASIKEKEEGGSKFYCPKCASKNTKHVFSLKSFFSNDKSGGSGGGGRGCCCNSKCK